MPLFLAGVFEELHMLNRGHRNGLSSCRLADNTTLSSQHTHRRSSISDLLSKFAKWKVTVPSPPPPLTMQGRLLCKGGGG